MKEDKIFKTGDKPGIGKYRCIKCGHVHFIQTNYEELPQCPKCPDTNWEKVTIEHNF